MDSSSTSEAIGRLLDEAFHADPEINQAVLWATQGFLSQLAIYDEKIDGLVNANIDILKSKYIKEDASRYFLVRMDDFHSLSVMIKVGLHYRVFNTTLESMDDHFASIQDHPEMTQVTRGDHIEYLNNQWSAFFETDLAPSDNNQLWAFKLVATCSLWHQSPQFPFPSKEVDPPLNLYNSYLDSDAKLFSLDWHQAVARKVFAITKSLNPSANGYSYPANPNLLLQDEKLSHCAISSALIFGPDLHHDKGTADLSAMWDENYGQMVAPH